ncbi:MAG: hypothetical protein JO043_01965 [Candidatus Eremiobacteraeota bacterium]|nr:hypothetical protein [Candidatus Eremiobacteraeota bacterium]
MRGSYAAVGILLLVASAAACSGGARVTPSGDSNGGQGQNPQLNATVTFRVIIPKASSLAHIRKTRDTVYVSSRTQSIGIQLATVNGNALQQTPPASVGNVPSACVGTSGCTVTIAGVPAAVGTDAFAVTTYAGTDANGAIVSQGLVPLTVTSSGNAGTIGGTALSVGGFVASLSLAVTPNTFYVGSAATATVYVVAYDAAGAIIIGNTQYAVPITVQSSPAPQFQVSYGTSQGASIVLPGPETQSSVVHVRYNGSTQLVSGTLSASSQDSGGKPIVARQNLAVVPAPTPTPTGTHGPSDLYVLNAADNTVDEFNPSTYALRRSFGGALGCKPQLRNAPSIDFVLLGTSGLSFDGSGNALVGTGDACAKKGARETFYALAPSAVGTASPSATYVTSDANVNTFNGLAYDPTLQYLDASDGSQNLYLYEYRLRGQKAIQAAALGQTSGAPTCFLTPGVSQCGQNVIAPGTFVTYAINSQQQLGQTMALDGRGTAYYPAVSDNLFHFDIVGLTLATEPSSGPPTVNAAWVAGITPYSQNYGPADANRLSNYPLALWVDGNVLFVLNYPTQQTLYISPSQRYPPYYPPAAICNANPSATPSPVSNGSLCKDGTAHEFLTAYDLSQLLGSGPVNLQPVLVVGGDQWPGNAAAGAQFADRLAVGGGFIYVAEPAGLSCDAQCLATLGKKPVGQIAVYPENLRGVHINDSASAPVAVVSGSSVKVPTGVSWGPQGSAQK